MGKEFEQKNAQSTKEEKMGSAHFAELAGEVGEVLFRGGEARFELGEGLAVAFIARGEGVMKGGGRWLAEF